MKKIIFILALFVSFVANSQYTPPPGYTNINSRYDWLAGVFRALGIPAGGNAAFTTGQAHRAGAIYYDSVGVDSGLYVWTGLAWRNYDPSTLTASEGITKVGSDFQLGGLVTSDRTITVNNGSFKIHASKNVAADYLFLALDTISNPDLDADIPFAGFLAKRTLRFPVYSSTTYRVGAQFALNYQIKDSARIATIGGDYGMAHKTDMVLEKMSGYSGRSVFMGGDGVSLSEGVPIQLSGMTLLQGQSTPSNYRYAKGYWVGNRSYIVIGANDTVQKWAGFHSMGFNDGGKIDYTFDFIGGHFGDQSVAKVTNPWFLYGHSTRSKSFIAGPTGFGDSTIDASALVDMSSTTKGMLPPRMTAAQRSAIGSPGPSLFLWDNDSTRYMGYNGTVWKGIAWTGEGGGTPTLQQVLDAGSTLTSSETITLSNNSTLLFDKTGTGTALNVTTNGGQAIVASVTDHNGIDVSTTGSGFTGIFNSDNNSTTGQQEILRLARKVTSTPSNDISGGISFYVPTTSNLNGAFANQLNSKMSNVTHASRTSEVDILGVDNAVTETFMNIQKDLVRINNNADTLATKAYARSVGGGGGGDVTKVGTPSNHQLAIWTGDGTIKGNTLTGNRALVTDADGEPIAATTTDTEIGYVNGVTSAIQTQIDGKIGGSLTSTRVPFATAATTLADDASMTWDNTNKRLTLGNNSGFFPLILDGGNGATTSGQLVIRSAGVNKVYFSAGTSQSDLYTTNHSFRVYTNGTGNLSFRVGGSTGITYNAEHATTGAHIFQTNTVTRAVIDNSGAAITGNISLTAAGNKLNITTGTNASIGVSAAMTAGTITISTTAVTANSIIILTHATLGGTQGILSVGTITAGTSFVINSSNAADTGTVNWWIVN